MQAIERTLVFQDWITILFLLAIVTLVLAKYFYPQRFNEFISLLGSGKFIAFKGKENKAFHPFNILMFVVQSLIFSILIFMIYRAAKPTLEDPGILLIRILTAYICLVLIKLGIEKLIGEVFDMGNTLDYYLFQKISYRNFLSLGLIPVVMILFYTFNAGWKTLAIITVIALLINAIGLILIYRKNQGLINHNWFYFILYLCALEIAPYIILYKVITT